jgi:hypothetical protein
MQKKINKLYVCLG